MDKTRDAASKDSEHAHASVTGAAVQQSRSLRKQIRNLGTYLAQRLRYVTVKLESRESPP
jgi:hypothetical protein